MTALVGFDPKTTKTNLSLLAIAVICLTLSHQTSLIPVHSLTQLLKELWLIMIESRFFKASIASFCVIIFSELGDKTFFISAILAMKHSRTTVFVGSMTANIVMNAISVMLGIITQFIPRYLIDYISVSFFGFFGVKMIVESYMMPNTKTNVELEEAEDELKKLEATDEHKTDYKNILSNGLPFLSLVFIETFCLIFFAEWGDRSQMSTIVLAASEGPTGVIVGSLLGYSVCTAIAVLGGRFIAQVISIRTVTLIGGILFLAFAGLAIVFGQ